MGCFNVLQVYMDSPWSRVFEYYGLEWWKLPTGKWAIACNAAELAESWWLEDIKWDLSQLARQGRLGLVVLDCVTTHSAGYTTNDGMPGKTSW